MHPRLRSALALRIAAGALLLLTRPPSSRADVLRWSDLAAFPAVTTAIRTLAIDPTTPSTIYAGVSNGAIAYDPAFPLIPLGDGVFKSADGGASWTAINDGLSNLRVVAIVIDPQSPATLYVGVEAGGVFKSSNGGASWTPRNAGLPDGLELYSLALDPQTPSTLYAGFDEDGVFKSIDTGVTWSPSSNGLGTGAERTIWGLAVDPQTPSTLYAATSDGVHKSADAGATWARTAPTMFYEYNGGSIDIDRRSYTLVIDPTTNPSTVYVGTFNAGGVFKTIDGGASWSEANRGLDYLAGYRYVYSLALDQQNPSTLYAGTQGGGIFRTTNGGALWIPVNTGLAGGDVNAIAIDATTAATYAGTGYGRVQAAESVPLRLDPFRCFRATARSPVSPVTALLVDELEGGPVTIGQPVSLCEPVDVAGQGTIDPTAHLTCYKIKPQSSYGGPPLVLLDNQFASSVLGKPKPAALCVPSERDGVPSPLALNRFTSYRAERVDARPYAVSVEGALGSQTTKFYSHAGFAVPVTKDGTAPIDPTAHLTCFRLLTRAPRYGYRIPPLAFTPQDVSVQNEFGTQILRLVKPETLCLPSLHPGGAYRRSVRTSPGRRL
jgi:photosystem II stability/assembly factor-like uncharacterized protein